MRRGELQLRIGQERDGGCLGQKLVASKGRRVAARARWCFGLQIAWQTPTQMQRQRRGRHGQ
eukprot:2296429-Pleurochrysis_carterae.AAC.1